MATKHTPGKMRGYFVTIVIPVESRGDAKAAINQVVKKNASRLQIRNAWAKEVDPMFLGMGDGVAFSKYPGDATLGIVERP